jgi:5-methylcytosine-specific restriction endonuclease McrA
MRYEQIDQAARLVGLRGHSGFREIAKAICLKEQWRFSVKGRQNIILKFYQKHLDKINAYEDANFSDKYIRQTVKQEHKNNCNKFQVVKKKDVGKFDGNTRNEINKLNKFNRNNIDFVISDAFLESYAWRQIRLIVLKRDGRRCVCCGATPDTGAVMHVDHIKPRRLFPELALDEKNLQVLCSECNHGKGNWDQTDFKKEKPRTDPEVLDLQEHNKKYGVF